MIRLYEPLELTEQLTLSKQNFHYLSHVRRKAVGDHVVILNASHVGTYQIAKIDKKSMTCQLVQLNTQEKPQHELIVYQSIVKREYMDTILEKLGEIGVTKVVPVMTSRSIGSIKSSTMDRYRQLLVSGALQAEHPYLPAISEPIKLSDIEIDTDQFYLFYEREDQKMLPKVSENSVSLFIGPEGGISDEELKTLTSKGANVISPISSVLKAETAAVVFTGLIKCLMEIDR